MLPSTDAYDPCPCGSGKKYKFCCKEGERGVSPPDRPVQTAPPRPEPQFHPIAMLDVVASHVKKLASDSREFFSIILEGSRKPHMLDDALVERMESVLGDRVHFLGLYREQLSRWRKESPTPDQIEGIEAAEKDLAVSQELTDRARALVDEKIKPGTIDRVLSMSDVEVGVEAVRRLLARAGR